MWGWQCAFTCHVDITHASERLEKVWTRYIVFFTLWPTVDWSNAWILLHWVTLILYPDPDWCQSQQVKDCRLPSGAMDNRKMSVEMRLPLLLLARCWTAAQQTSLYSARWRLVSQRSQSNLLLKRWRQAVHALPRGDHVSPTTPSFANFLLTLTVMIQCCWLLTEARHVELWAAQGSHGPCFTPLLPHQPPLPPFWPRSWLPGLFHFLPPPPHCPPSYKARGSSAFFALISTTTTTQYFQYLIFFRCFPHHHHVPCFTIITTNTYHTTP